VNAGVEDLEHIFVALAVPTPWYIRSCDIVRAVRGDARRVTGLFIYFSVAVGVLRGTLL
jgi:hypothetical protein